NYSRKRNRKIILFVHSPIFCNIRQSFCSSIIEQCYIKSIFDILCSYRNNSVDDEKYNNQNQSGRNIASERYQQKHQTSDEKDIRNHKNKIRLKICPQMHRT